MDIRAEGTMWLRPHFFQLLIPVPVTKTCMRHRHLCGSYCQVTATRLMGYRMQACVQRIYIYIYACKLGILNIILVLLESSIWSRWTQYRSWSESTYLMSRWWPFQLMSYPTLLFTRFRTLSWNPSVCSKRKAWYLKPEIHHALCGILSAGTSRICKTWIVLVEKSACVLPVSPPSTPTWWNERLGVVTNSHHNPQFSAPVSSAGARKIKAYFLEVAPRATAY